MEDFKYNLKKYSALIGCGLVACFMIFAVIAGRKQREERERELEEEYRQVQEELEKETFRTEEAIYEHLLDSMLNDDADNVYMRVPGTFSKDDLTEIAQRIDPMIGRVDRMSYTASTTREGDGPEVEDYYVGVNYHYEMSDEYYVLEKIQNGKEIPSDKSNAIKLCSVSEKFLSDNISPGMTDYDKELAIHDFIVENCEYSFSDANDMSEYYAYGALVNKKAVCSGYARATALLLKCCDVDVNLISGDADNNTGDSSEDGVSDEDGLIAPDGTVVDGHMWNQVKIDGLWYNLDTTWDDPIGETELRHTYFNVDDSILGLNHEWDKKEAEQCSSTLQNYYEKNGIFFKTSSSFKDALSEYLAAGNRDEYECAVSYVDTNEEFLSFIFDYEGITSYQVATRGEESAYQILTIYFNPEPE